MNKISHLIFDVGGVIVLQQKTDWAATDRVLGLSLGMTKQIVDDCFKKRMADRNFDERKYFTEKYSALMTWEKYQDMLSSFFSREKVNEDLVHWINQKKEKNFKIYALTNNTAALDNLLAKKFKIENIFDRVFNSAEIGLTKPNPRLFEYVLHEIRATPETCLFVDDSKRNVQAAKRLGFVSILFKSNYDLFFQIRMD